MNSNLNLHCYATEARVSAKATPLKSGTSWLELTIIHGDSKFELSLFVDNKQSAYINALAQAINQATDGSDQILIDPEFWGPEYKGDTLCGRVTTILRDSNGDQYVVFEMADQAGLQIIHLGSRFFRGWESTSLTVDAARCQLAPKGECTYCDRERAANNPHFPPHDASPRCESGKRNHCTCDICW